MTNETVSETAPETTTDVVADEHELDTETSTAERASDADPPARPSVADILQELQDTVADEPAEDAAADIAEEQADDAADAEQAEESEEPEAEDSFSTRYRQAVAKEREVAQAVKELEPYARYQDLFQSDPAQAIENLVKVVFGEEVFQSKLTEIYDQLSYAVLGLERQVNPYKVLERKHEELVRQLGEERKASELQQEQQAQLQQEQEILEVIRGGLEDSGDTYYYLMNQTEESPEVAVFQAIWEEHQKNIAAGKKNPPLMSYEVAAQLLDEHFEEVANKWAKIKRPKQETARRSPGKSPQTNAARAAAKPTPQLTRTTPGAPTRAPSGLPTKEERLNDAWKAIKGGLHTTQ